MSKTEDNKKALTFIPIVFIVTVLAGLLVFMVLPQNYSDITAQNGVLDLRGESGEIFPLHGEWEFAFGELLTPDEFHGRTSDLIHVPDSWDAHGFPLRGHATYRLTILTDEQRPFTIFVSEIYSANILWINGEIAQYFGSVSADPLQEHFAVGNTLVTVVPENGAIELVFQVSNYQYLNAGIRNPMYFGESSLIYSWFFRTRLLYTMTLGLILMAAFYHLTLFIFRRHEKIYLFFTLLCLLAFARFFIGTNGLNGFIQLFPETLTLLRVFNALFATHGIAVFAFSMYIFNSDFFRKYKYAVGAVFAVIFFTSIAVHPGSTWYIPIMSALMLPVGVFTIIFAARSKAFKENAMLRLYFAAVVIFIVFGATFVVFLRAVLFMPALLNNVFLIMVQSLVLSRRYTDALEAEQRLAAENAVLANLSRMKTEFLKDIQHEVRSPLLIISTGTDFTNHCLDTGDMVKARDMQSTIQNEAMRLGRMVNGMVELATESAEQSGDTSREKIDFAEMIKTCAENTRLVLEQRGNSLLVEIAPDLPHVYAEAEQLTRVPVNIFANAVRSTENGKISVKATANEGYITVQITDTGEGIAAELLPHVFERGISGKGGKGYGLSICKTIVEAHGGTIEIESEQGAGTTVTFTIPVYGGQSEEAKHE